MAYFEEQVKQRKEYLRKLMENLKGMELKGRFMISRREIIVERSKV